METLLDTLIAVTLFAPLALIVVSSLALHRREDYAVSFRAPARVDLPFPPARTRAAVANDARYLEAA
jgi:hypothetical protein